MANDTEKISRSDIVKYSQMYTNRIHTAQVLYTEKNFRKFIRCVDIFADSLLPKEDKKIQEFILSLDTKDEVKRRREILKETIKILSPYLHEPELTEKGFAEK